MMHICTLAFVVFTFLVYTNGISRSSMDLKTTDCVLEVRNDSKEQFSSEVFENEFNFMEFHLTFENLTIKETKPTIAGNKWLWTYQGENGGYQYLHLPFSYGYKSFGLLWLSTRREPLSLTFDHSGNCSALEVGSMDTDLLIGEALGRMATETVKRHPRYANSYWCYRKRTYIDSDFLYEMCKHSVCTLRSIDYSCCHYEEIPMTKTRHMLCGVTDFLTADVWWILPIIMGNMCFIVYPLGLLKLAMILNPKQDHKDESVNTEASTLIVEAPSFLTNQNYNPISFYSTVFYPCFYLFSKVFGTSFCRRIFGRSLIIWIPVSICLTHVLLDYYFYKDFLQKAVGKGALLSFDYLIASYTIARKNFLYYLGGPVVAIALSVIVIFAVLALPKDLEKTLERGMNNSTEKVFYFIATMPIDLKETLSRIPLSNTKGYKKFYNYLLAQALMVFNIKYWKICLNLFVSRIRIIFCEKCRLIFILLFFAFSPMYFVFCLIEICCSSVLFAIPVFSCFYNVGKAFVLYVDDKIQPEFIFLKIVKYLLLIPFVFLFLVSWYVSGLIFFDVFWFLSDILLFTYTGIIAFPKLSYGYIVLIIMAFYYFYSALKSFNDAYKQLLKLSISEFTEFTCTIEKSSRNRRCGLPRDLFELIVERHLPARNEAIFALVRFLVVLIILIVSIKLLLAFDKFKELSLITHVFTALFICSLPGIVRKMCIRSKKSWYRKSLAKDIRVTISEYLQTALELSQADQDQSSGTGSDDSDSFVDMHGQTHSRSGETVFTHLRYSPNNELLSDFCSDNH